MDGLWVRLEVREPRPSEYRSGRRNRDIPGQRARGGGGGHHLPECEAWKADNVWIPPDNTAFIVRSLSDNVTVFPRPDRYGAYYDNLTSPYNQLDNTYIGKDLCIRARGYFDDLNQSILSSYWISIGDLISPCP